MERTTLKKKSEVVFLQVFGFISIINNAVINNEIFWSVKNDWDSPHNSRSNSLKCNPGVYCNGQL